MAKVKTSVVENVVKQALGEGAKFVIVELSADGPKPVYGDDGQLLKFANGPAANAAARAHSERTGLKFQPRPVNDDSWRSREEERARSKEYLPLPWHQERWWLDLKDVWKDHFPHAAIKNGAVLAYTETPEKGAADIQTQIKPGRYLERYFGHVLNNYAIRDLCSVFSEKYENNLLMWATTAEEMREVYENGPASCMSKPASEFSCKPLHPVEVYAAGDIHVAYLKKEGRCSARVVVDIRTKKYSTIYGDKGRLEPLLKKAGYTGGAPSGARLVKHKIPVSEDKGKTYMFATPHLDNVGWVYVDKNGDLRVGETIDNQEALMIQAGGARGVTEPLGYSCDSCKRTDLTTRGVTNVFISDDKARHWCLECTKANAFKCNVTGYMVANDQGLVIPHSRHRMWRRLEKSHSFICEGSRERAWNEDKVVLRDGRVWSRNHYKTHGSACMCGKPIENGTCDDKCRKRTEAKRAAPASSTYVVQLTTTSA